MLRSLLCNKNEKSIDVNIALSVGISHRAYKSRISQPKQPSHASLNANCHISNQKKKKQPKKQPNANWLGIRLILRISRYHFAGYW